MLVCNSASIYCEHMPCSMSRVAAPNDMESTLNFRVAQTCCSEQGFPPQTPPYGPTLLYLVLSDHMTLLQSSRVQCQCSRADSNLCFDESWKEQAYLPLTLDTNLSCFNVPLMVWTQTPLSRVFLSSVAVWADPDVILWTRCFWPWAECLAGCPPHWLGRV